MFEEEVEEITNIANKIKSIQIQNPQAQIAILVRNNYQVEKYENILKINLGLQKEITSEQLKEIKDFMKIDIDGRKLKSFINKMLKLFAQEG